MSISAAVGSLRARRVSCVELLDECLRAVGSRNGELNAFITLTADRARQQARALDAELARGDDRGPLHGIPIALKDLFFTAGIKTTNGSAVFRDFVPDYDATVVRKLEAAGAVMVGKLNMHECAYGITSSNPHFGPVRNPWNRECIPGGSSGGSGAAVAAGMAVAAMGSDTGGSIRIPASYCGVVGLKPTFGRVSRYGCFPLGLTLDHMGPLTRTVEDSALVLDAIAGADPKDETTRTRGRVTMPDAAFKGMRLGLPSNFFFDATDEEVGASVLGAIDAARGEGAEIINVDAPDPVGLNVVARTILLAEASAVMTPYLHRRDDFGSDVLSLLDQGRLLAATEYVNAQRIRRRMQREWAEMFRRIDVLVTPTTPIPAPQIGAKTVIIGRFEEDARLASTRLVRGINALGLPALSVPCGRTRAGLPIGLQIVGRAWAEGTVLAAGAAFERLLGQAS
jgi:aspartyl-tRNA(Asn)/glutamyl-tRNA(Gln) amidotransferase subunit A